MPGVGAQRRCALKANGWQLNADRSL